MTKRDIAGYLDVDVKTIYNWEKFKPNLYKTVMQGLAVNEAIKTTEDSLEKLKKVTITFDKNKTTP